MAGKTLGTGMAGTAAMSQQKALRSPPKTPSAGGAPSAGTATAPGTASGGVPASPSGA